MVIGATPAHWAALNRGFGDRIQSGLCAAAGSPEARAHGQRPPSSTSSEKLKNVLMRMASPQKMHRAPVSIYTGAPAARPPPVVNHGTGGAAITPSEPTVLARLPERNENPPAADRKVKRW